MDNVDLCCDSIYQQSLNQLCYSMDENTLKLILEQYPGSIVLEVIWKVSYKLPT